MQATPEGPRTSPKFPVQFGTTLHDSTIMADSDYSRISNLVEGFHRGFKYESTESAPRLTVQKYFWAVREELVNTDFYLGRLTVGLTSINLLNIQP